MRNVSRKNYKPNNNVVNYLVVILILTREDLPTCLLLRCSRRTCKANTDGNPVDREEEKSMASADKAFVLSSSYSYFLSTITPRITSFSVCRCRFPFDMDAGDSIHIHIHKRREREREINAAIYKKQESRQKHTHIHTHTPVATNRYIHWDGVRCCCCCFCCSCFFCCFCFCCCFRNCCLKMEMGEVIASDVVDGSC